MQVSDEQAAGTTTNAVPALDTVQRTQGGSFADYKGFFPVKEGIQ